MADCGADFRKVQKLQMRGLVNIKMFKKMYSCMNSTSCVFVLLLFGLWSLYDEFYFSLVFSSITKSLLPACFYPQNNELQVKQ